MKTLDEHLLCPTCGHRNPADAFYCQKDGTPLREQDGEPHASDSDPLVGRMVGNYRLLSRKGEGGFGVVYRAEHRDLGTTFAVKILHPQFSANRQAAERFKREALAAGRLRHEHVVYIADFGFAKGIGYYYAMEYLEGRTLKEAMEGEKPFALERIISIARQVTAAMERVHSLKIVHRDLKPENIFLITKNGLPDYVKLVDFGIAKMMDEAASNLTRTGLSVGTPLYMSPEQARGNLRTLDHRTDLYSWAVILYEMLTGRPPFFSDNPHDVVMLHIRAPHPPLSDISPFFSFHPDIEAFFRRALAKSPAERHESMSAFLHDLEALLTRPDAFRRKDVPPPAFALSPPSDDLRDPLDETPAAPSRILTPHVDLTYVSTTNDQIALPSAEAAALRSADLSSLDSTPPEESLHLRERSTDWRSVFQTDDPSLSFEEDEETAISPDFLREEVKSLSRQPSTPPPLSSALEEPAEGHLPHSSPDLEEIPPPVVEKAASTSGLRTVPNLDILPVPPSLLAASPPLTAPLSPKKPAPSASLTAPLSKPPASRPSASFDDLLDARTSPRIHRAIWIGGSILGSVGILFLLIVAFLPSPSAPPTPREGTSLAPAVREVPPSRPPPSLSPLRPEPPKQATEPPKRSEPHERPEPTPPPRPTPERPLATEAEAWTLTIDAQPPATCVLNHQDFGTTPCIHQGQGRKPVSIELSRKGFLSFRTSWRFSGKSKETLTFKLKRRRSSTKGQPPQRRSSDGLFEDTQNPFDQPDPRTPRRTP